MFGIKIKPETKAKVKAKWDRVVKAVTPWVIPAFVFTTISAAWSGHINSVRNEREIKELKEYADRIDIGAYNLISELDNRMGDLEAKNEQLLQKAMEVTEGKEGAA